MQKYKLFSKKKKKCAIIYKNFSKLVTMLFNRAHALSKAILPLQGYGRDDFLGLVSTEDVTCVYLLFDICKRVVETVGDDGFGKCFELAEVVDNT